MARECPLRKLFTGFDFTDRKDRARWIKLDGSSEYGVTVPVRALEPTTG